MAEWLSPEALGAQVRERARGLGFDLVGFARAEAFARERELILEDLAQGHLAGMAWITADRVRLSCDPEALLPGARSIVAVGTAYARPRRNPPPQPSPASGEGANSVPSPSTGEGNGWGEASTRGRPQGRIARYAWGRDYHYVLKPRLRALSDAIAELAGQGTRCRWFVDTGPLVDRAAAERAGIGFIGKNTCVLTGRHGSYVFLSAVLTTAELAPDPLVVKDCGSCRACLDACPTGAFVGPRQLDATRCISYLTIEHRGPIPEDLRPLMGSWVFGCDVCQEVCPWNRARPSSTHPEFDAGQGAGETLDLIEVLGLDESAFRARFAGTPLTRPKRAGLLRNAAVVLGNLRDPAAVPALRRALEDPEPLVQEHAAWALGQMGVKVTHSPGAP